MVQLKQELILFSLLLLAAYSAQECDKTFFENVIKEDFEDTEYSLDDWGENIVRPLEEQNYIVVKSGSNLKELCEGFSTTDVTEIILINVGLEKVEDGAFGATEKPYCVRMQHNNLQSVKAGMFSNSSILALNISNNNIEHIDSDAFDDMAYLEVIILNDNKIQAWNPVWFTNTPSVHEISITNNLLSNLPEHTLKNINGTYEIDLTSGLSSIDFGFNRIASIHPDAFKDQKKFGKIILESNFLTSIAPEVFEGMDVDAIAIDNNPIACFSNETLYSWKAVQLVEIAGITLTEECQKTLDDFKANNKKPYIFNEVDQF